MAKGDASASRATVQLAALVPDIISFILRPRMMERSSGWTWITLLLVGGIVAFDLGLDWMLKFWLERADQTLFDLPELVNIERSLRAEILSLLILAPIVEEALFRGWMSGHRASLRFVAWGAFGFGLVLLSETPFTDSFWVVLVAVGLLASAFGFIQWIRTRNRDDDVPAWFARNFHWLVWMSALLFGGLHLFNYQDITGPIALLVVSPEILGGLLLAYSRVRFGLRAAILHHAAYNLYFMLSYRLF